MAHEGRRGGIIPELVRLSWGQTAHSFFELLFNIVLRFPLMGKRPLPRRRYVGHVVIACCGYSVLRLLQVPGGGGQRSLGR